MEQAFLSIVQLDPRFATGGSPWSLEDEAQELAELSRAAGCRVVGEARAKRHEPIAGTFLGRGKLEEIHRMVHGAGAGVVIFNQELSPAQQRNIEDLVGVKTIDRTQLILDIFAQRAHSQEGKVQVELAQLRYLLPRLVGKGVMLSRLGGGIGTRGPGEQKLEMDRRRIRVRLGRLSEELARLRRRRQATRARRREREMPVVALVGYTNAGKTTLLNRFSAAAAAVRDQLFTTLDPLARRARLPDGETIILTDTVGFLHQLPHHLIEAFHATLEEASDADVLLHVLDAGHPRMVQLARAVDEVLAELGLQERPLITVFNKCDLLNPPATRTLEQVRALEFAYHPAATISAKTGEGLDRLCALIAEQLSLRLVEPMRLRVPAERSDVVAAVYQSGQVLKREEANGMVELLARLPARVRSQLSGFLKVSDTFQSGKSV